MGFNFDEKFVKFAHNKRAGALSIESSRVMAVDIVISHFSVTRIKFGVNSPSLLAFSSVDKTLTVVDICDYKTLNTKPNILKGTCLHSRFVFSIVRSHWPDLRLRLVNDERLYLDMLD